MIDPNMLGLFVGIDWHLGHPSRRDNSVGFAGPWMHFADTFKDLQSRVERTFLKEAEVVDVVDNPATETVEVTGKTHNMNPTRSLTTLIY